MSEYVFNKAKGLSKVDLVSPFDGSITSVVLCDSDLSSIIDYHVNQEREDVDMSSPLYQHEIPELSEVIQDADEPTPYTLGWYIKVSTLEEIEKWLMPDYKGKEDKVVDSWEVYGRSGGFVGVFKNETPLHEVEMCRYYFDLGAAKAKRAILAKRNLTLIDSKKALKSALAFFRWLFVHANFTEKGIVIKTKKSRKVKAFIFKSMNDFKKLVEQL